MQMGTFPNRCSRQFAPAMPLLFWLRWDLGRRILDHGCDADELHAWSHAVEIGNPLRKLWGEECSRSILGFPDVKVERFPVPRVDGKGLGAQARQAHKPASRRLGDLPHPRFAEPISVA